MRLSSTALTFVSVFAAACGDDGGSTTPDAPIKDIGFTKPTASLKANNEVSDNNWMELGPANLACLNTPSADMASANAITVNTVVSDFQSGNLVPNTTVTVFANQDQNNPFAGGPYTSDGSTAAISVTIPAGTKRFGYKMVNPAVALDTLLLNQSLDSTTMTPQTASKIQSVSTQTAATLPALIGVSRTSGTGILAGAVRDCDDNEISNFIATVSSTPNTVTHLDGVDTYYFSSSVGLPVRHSQQKSSAKDGLFMAIEMQPTTTAYIQVWGYPTDADLAADDLKLIAQLQTQVIADVVITGSYEPLRQ